MIQAVTLLIIALLTIIDRLIRYSVIHNLKAVNSKTVIDGILQFRYAENTGAAFGSLQGKTIALAIFTFIIILAALYILLAKKIKPGFLYASLVLIVAGGICNLIDRVFYGYVIDYIEPLFINFAIFNFADCLITVGAVAMMIYLIYDMVKDVKKNQK